MITSEIDTRTAPAESEVTEAIRGLRARGASLRSAVVDRKRALASAVANEYANGSPPIPQETMEAAHNALAEPVNCLSPLDMLKAPRKGNDEAA